MIGKMTLEGHLKKGYDRDDNSGAIWQVVGYSWRIKSDEFIYSKKTVLEFLYQCKILSV